MASVIPLTIQNGQIQRIQSADTLAKVRYTKTINIGRQNSNDEIQINTYGKIPISYASEIKAWRIAEGNEYAGSIVIDILKGSTYAGATSIAGSEKPTLSSQDDNSDLTLSTWTPSVVAGDLLWFVVESCSGCYQIELVLEMELS